MTKKFSFYIITTVFLVGVFSSIFPYPVFQHGANISIAQQEKINNYNETEIIIEQNSPNQDKLIVSTLNWFDIVNNQFPSYVKTRIVDVYSGKTYYIYRIGGTNHADVEPIDAENAEIFHSLYDYEYSWARRPVWVEINENQWVAGSINGYPHGDSYISNNNMNGHTCIHFLMSKTHGTQKVDKSHQDCVEYAYKNGIKLNEIINKDK